MTIRWGVSPIAWANDDLPDLGGGTSLTTILGDARAIGFDGIELGHLFPRDPVVLAPIMAAHDLALIGGWYGARLLERDAEAEIVAMEPHLALLKAMDATVFIIAETSNAVHTDRTAGLGMSPRLDGDGWALFAQRLDRIATHVASHGLRLAYHHHIGTVVETADDLDRLLTGTGPDVGLVLDTGHAVYGGIDPVAVVRDHHGRIAHVHCKDIRADRHATLRAGGGSFLDGVIAGMFTTPGDGDYPFRPFLSALRAIDYSGWIVIEAEQDPAKADPRVYSQSGLDTLQTIAGEVGLCGAANGGDWTRPNI